MVKVEPVHLDYLDRPIAVGNAVAYVQGGILKVGVVDKINPVMVRVVPLAKKNDRYYYTNRNFVNVIPNSIIIIPREDLVWFQLKQ